MKMDKLRILWRANLHCLEAESGISKKFLNPVILRAKFNLVMPIYSRSLMCNTPLSELLITAKNLKVSDEIVSSPREKS